MTEAERVYHKTRNGETRISLSLRYISEFDFRELNHKTRIFCTRISCFPTDLPELFSRDFPNSNNHAVLVHIQELHEACLLLWYLNCDFYLFQPIFAALINVRRRSILRANVGDKFKLHFSCIYIDFMTSTTQTSTSLNQISATLCAKKDIHHRRNSLHQTTLEWNRTLTTTDLHHTGYRPHQTFSHQTSTTHCV